jgi:glycosyltransferase involved in cell wall biosynthesis
MKIAIGYHLQEGPWGGGNQFARALAVALEACGHQVCFELGDRDIDLILLTEVRGRSPSAAFHAGTVLRYLQFCNPSAVVVHRINECDERKGTRHMNRLLQRANYVADHTVFVGGWLRELPLWRRGKASVILNGGDASTFQQRLAPSPKERQPLRVVTHHWGAHWMKGFDVYELLDELLQQDLWHGKFEFTYVGNVPPGFRFSKAQHLQPLSGSDLAAELSSHHVYITGSINEPGAMHPVEGALCGLPIIYRQSGAMPEYCKGFGIGFSKPAEAPAALERMMAEYDRWRAALEKYPHTAERMCREYIELFERLVSERDEIVARRRLWREPWTVLRNQIPL